MLRTLVVVGLLLLAAPPGHGQAPVAATAGAPPAAGSAAAKAADVPPTVAARTAALERHDGFLPFYWDAREGRLLLEVARLEQEFLYAVGLAQGAGVLEASLDRGQLGDSALVRFERAGPRVLLHRLQTTHVSGVADPEITRAVRESFPSAVLAALPIVAEEPGRLLVDATELVLRDSVVLPLLRASGAGAWSQDAARAALRLERSGAFPGNTEIEALLTFTSDAPPPGIAAVLPDGRTMSLLVHHSFLALPEPGYEPLEADPRVGFLASDVKLFGVPFSEPLGRSLAARWRLQKKDPAAAVSEPVQPIVLHLDRGMPEPERSAVRAAALWWNHAFEDAGLREAVVIRDLPEGASFLDARYSGIEWIHRRERAWSIGEFRTDPRTGEIIHAVARIDSHRRRTTSRMWRNLRKPGAVGDPNRDEQAFVLQRLAYLSAHEVGHTLGLDHNWAATTFGWGSVMDYLGANVQLREGRLDLSDAYPVDVGAYDRLAIRWGYTPGASAAARDGLLREARQRGVVFPLEADPRWAEYDWGADPVEWLRTTLDVRGEILRRFGPGQLEPGEPVYTLQERLSLAYLYHRFGIQAAQQHVGGQYQVGAVAGDEQPAARWVDAAQQRRALELLLECLSPAQLDLPERIEASLTSAPRVPPSPEEFVSAAGPVWSVLSAARTLADLVVRPLLQPERAARLVLPAQQDRLSLRQLLSTLTTATWAAAPAASPRLRALQRVAQRSVLDGVLDLAAAPESAVEVRATAIAALEKLERTLAATAVPADADGAAQLRLARRDLRDALTRPELLRQRRPAAPVPPGRPIGGSAPWLEPD